MPLAVVSDSHGISAAVISPNHMVNILATAGVDALGFNAGAIMTNSQTVSSAPILGDDRRAQGILFARDVATELLAEVNYDEQLLPHYVMGVGYQW